MLENDNLRFVSQPTPAVRPPQTRLRRRGAIIYSLLVLIMMGLSLTSCYQFLAEGGVGIETFLIRETARANGLTLTMQIVETNLEREHMKLYVVPKVTGSYAQGSPRLPAREIELTLASTSGPRVFNFKRDHHLEPFDLEISFSDGHILMYPHDSYQGWIEAGALAVAPGGGTERLPVVVEFNPRNHAMHVAPRLSRQAESGDIIVRLTVTRLVPIVVFTWFMAGIAAGIALTVVLVVFSVISGRRQPEIAMLVWCTALLFALPAVPITFPARRRSAP
jgi:hypothetical protein